MAKEEILTPDICVIGAGSGGLSVAAAAAAFKVPVVLIEKGKMGGDCLNYGCVPSKALITAGKYAHSQFIGGKYGVNNEGYTVNFGQVHDHVHSVIGAIEPNDSVERFTSMGVNVIQGEAKFADKKTVVVGDQKIRARRFVIATGSSAAVPPIKGLDKVPYFTNETIFDNTRRMGHLIIVGGGPIGLELAHAYKRLGTDVTVLEAFKAMGREDPELSAIVINRLREDGVNIIEGAKVDRFEENGGGVRAVYEKDGSEETVEGTHLLIAAGRAPNVKGLDLEKADIRYSPKGIETNDKLKTTNPRVFAIGDVAGRLQFTHVANYHAGLVIRAILFRMPAKEKTIIIPRVTFTDPELAWVGMTEEEARETHKDIRILRWPYAENDRAQAEKKTEGFVKAIVDKRGKILAAGVVGAHAGELIQTWTMAITQGLKIKAFTDMISPYPTYSEVSKRAAVTFFTPSLANPNLQKLLKFLRWFG